MLLSLVKQKLSSPSSFIFTILRNFFPIITIKNNSFVFRFTDVQRVLLEDDNFGVPYKERMAKVTDGGNFFLGMDIEDPNYTIDKTNMQLVINRDDIPEIILPYVRKEAQKIIAASKGEIDVVKSLAYQVSANLMADYLGVSGADSAELIDWSSSLFEYLFFDILDNTTLNDKEFLTKSKLFREYLDNLIKKRKKAKFKSDFNQNNILDRCLILQKNAVNRMNDIYIRNNMLGIIIGAIPTTARSVALVLEYLINNPKILKQARQAALDDDLTKLKPYIFEALRMNPFTPILLRNCKRDYRFKGLISSHKIRQGNKVFAVVQSAMFDSRVVTKPKDFRTDRKASDYMIFGAGFHHCFGRYINQVQITEIVRPLLQKPNLRFADNSNKAVYQNNMPLSLKLKF